MMLNLKDLKVNNEYYIVDENGCYEDTIIKFKVIHKLKGNKNKGFAGVQFLKYIYDYGEVDVKYSNTKDNKIVIEQLYKEDEERIFKINELNAAREYLNYIIDEHELIDIDDYTPPEEYPDWDGDESIMYYIDHYVEEDEDIEDEEDIEEVETWTEGL
ncbi:TPA: hypothetical protein N2D16_002911 [Clostridium botulinum]|nr:hypothetical protein [Clostridium botulinum]